MFQSFLFFFFYKYPHLPQEQLTQQVQAVIRQMISRQIAAQQEAAKRQVQLVNHLLKITLRLIKFTILSKNVCPGL